ncbi:MAG: amidohydrolase family protein [Candidatus Binataceae bacterium]|nr:amidohydrolase family protein [Candidatus Binataceae bacterium]
MATTHPSKSAAIRARLKHPIIDSDGHQMELPALFQDYIAAVAGARIIDRFKAVFFDGFLDPRWRDFSPAERHDRRVIRPTWWGCPARNTRDLATALMPQLFHERMDEMGLDVSVVYPTLGLLAMNMEDEEVRRAAARALNRMKADMFAGLTDRLIPVATIPMHTPREAIEELEYAVGELGLRAVMMASYVRRPVGIAQRISPEAARYSSWIDTYGLDSEYDYDPVWRKCLELKVSPTFHSVGYGWGSRATPSNYVHNHLGNFASSADAVCRGLLMGGVPQRFPELRFAFMEGGVAWARNLYCDAISHWHKRNRIAIENYNPAGIDDSLFAELAGRYGAREFPGRAAEMLASFKGLMSRGEDPALLDEWGPSGVTRPEDLRDIFTRRFYFGCEGDDPLNALAFDGKGSPFGARLHVLYGSDLGHWDVPEMAEAAEEAYEMVEHGVMSADDFRAMVFTDAAEFWTAANPDFFKGTVVEGAVSKLAAR